MNREGPILVTGASGFVGEHLVRWLHFRGEAVVGTYRTHPIELPGVHLLSLDLSGGSAVTKMIREIRPRAVAHLAALTNVATCQQQPSQARRDIVDATRNLVRAVAAEIPGAPLVALSTDLVFDGRSAPYQEGDPTNPLSVYGQLKCEAEPLVQDYSAGVVLRSALIYGPPATHASSFLGWMRDTLAAGKKLTLFEDEYRTPIAVSDLCEAIVQMLQNPRPGLWHAGGGDRCSRLQMGIEVADLFDLPRHLLAPTRLADSSYGAPRPADTSLDSRRLWEVCGHAPKTFREGIREIYRQISRLE